MSGGTRHSSAVSLGGHRTLGDGQHSDNGYIYTIVIIIITRSELASLAHSFNTCMKARIVIDQHVPIITCYSLHVHTKLSH